MSVLRLPVLLSRDAAGHYTGTFVDMTWISAYADSETACLAQLKSWAQFAMRNAPDDLPLEPLRDIELEQIPIEVRPQHVKGRRFQPCEYTVKLRVPCVIGREGTGFGASAPTIGVYFSFTERAKFTELACHYLADALDGKPPAEISAQLSVRECSLGEVVLPIPRERKAETRREYRALSAVAEPMGERGLRRQLSVAFERDAEVAGLIRQLRHDRASVLLLGEPGVGKTSVLAGAVRAIERVHEGADKRLFWLTGGARLIAGMAYLGQWEERLEQAIAELAELDGVLCVDNLLELLRIGGHGPGDSVGAFMIPYIRAGELRLVAEATPSELQACRRLLPGLADGMQVARVDPLDASTSLRVLERIARNHEANLGLQVSADAPRAVQGLFRRFRPYDAMPGRAVGFLSAACRHASEVEANLDADLALMRFGEESGLPDVLLRDELPLPRGEVASYLRRRVLGQDNACEVAADIVAACKAGLNDPRRPTGVLLFAGPTGVGKTELARALSDWMFGHGSTRDRLVRLDMSEYATHGSAEMLLSDERGQPSAFIRKVRQQPFCVVLLDEIEKAHPEVFDLLLGLLDEGRLTDRFGRLCSFQSAIIVMTSNLGAGSGQSLGFGARGGPDYEREVRRFFRPEFFNRLDAVVPFAALGPEIVRRIAAKELSELPQREGLKRAGLKLTWDEAVVDMVAAAGFDHRYGARPLQRAIEEKVVTPLARLLAEKPALAGITLHLSAGDETIQVQVR